MVWRLIAILFPTLSGSCQEELFWLGKWIEKPPQVTLRRHLIIWYYSVYAFPIGTCNSVKLSSKETPSPGITIPCPLISPAISDLIRDLVRQDPGSSPGWPMRVGWQNKGCDYRCAGWPPPSPDSACKISIIMLQSVELSSGDRHSSEFAFVNWNFYHTI